MIIFKILVAENFLILVFMLKVWCIKKIPRNKNNIKNVYQEIIVPVSGYQKVLSQPPRSTDHRKKYGIWDDSTDLMCSH